MGRWAQARHRGGGGIPFPPGCPEGLLPPDLTLTLDDTDCDWEMVPQGTEPGGYFMILFKAVAPTGPFFIDSTANQDDGTATGTVVSGSVFWYKAQTCENSDGSGCSSAQTTPAQPS